MTKKVTAKEIADILGISTMTVSRALNNRPNVNEKTRQAVVETAHQLGYFPNHIAKSLVLRKTNTIGVVVPEITHSFFPEVIRGIEEITSEEGYQLILTHSAEDSAREAEALITLTSMQVDGLLISTAQSVEDYSVYEQIIRRGLPLVFYDRCVNGIGASCVSIDDQESAFLVTEHLIQHGYKRIAHLSGPARLLIGKARLNGFREALTKYNLIYHENLVIEAGLQEQDGYLAMKKILELPKIKWPRAVVAVNDPAVFGAIKAIHEMGLSIPKDIAIVGFSDDIRAELIKPPLTTIRQNAYEVGKQAIKKLLDLIKNNKELIEEIIIRGELVVRESCGCNLTN